MSSSEFPIAIFHNPACGTSRNALAMIQAAGYEPAVVEYLEAGWTREQLVHLLNEMHAAPRDILRSKGTPAAELGLLDPNISDDALLAAMVEHPSRVRQLPRQRRLRFSMKRSRSRSPDLPKAAFQTVAAALQPHMGILLSSRSGPSPIPRTCRQAEGA